MAWTDFELPLTVTRVFDVLATAAEQGVVIRRERFPRANAQRFFRAEYQHMPLVDVQTLLTGLDAVKGAAVPFALTLPDVGTVTVSFDDDGYEYEVANGLLRHMVVNLREEVRL